MFVNSTATTVKQTFSPQPNYHMADLKGKDAFGFPHTPYPSQLDFMSCLYCAQPYPGFADESFRSWRRILHLPRMLMAGQAC
eukprot:symbB.v1.2.027765.t1/scaffold2862.1/size68630/5